jgi:hypothetical protein
MKKIIIFIAIFAVSAVASFHATNYIISMQNSNNDASIERVVKDEVNNIVENKDDIYKTIYLAGGCFWCIE